MTPSLFGNQFVKSYMRHKNVPMPSKKEKLHPIIKKLEIKMREDGDETVLRSIATQKKNYQSRIKKIPKNFKDAIQQCQ